MLFMVPFFIAVFVIWVILILSGCLNLIMSSDKPVILADEEKLSAHIKLGENYVPIEEKEVKQMKKDGYTIVYK